MVTGVSPAVTLKPPSGAESEPAGVVIVTSRDPRAASFAMVMLIGKLVPSFNATPIEFTVMPLDDPNDTAVTPARPVPAMVTDKFEVA